MKYYIPTTTLNFNNILSSESISPSSFFQKRGFGYSRWFDIPENPLNNGIVLYSSLSRLERDDSELEDHPMLIEINTTESFRQIESGIYVTDKTIYLNPWNTKFIFFNEQDRKVALSLSDSSLETKMIRLYQKGFEIHYPEQFYPKIKNEILVELNNSEIEGDRNINRLKGLMYGYYIGALLSTDKSNVNYYNTLKDLQNIFAAILSNPLREPTEEQEYKINFLMNSLLFRTPVIREIEEVVKNREKVVEIVRILTKYGQPICKVDSKSLLRELHDGAQDNNYALKWVSNELKQLNNLSQANRKLLSPDASELIVADNRLYSLNDNIISDKVENQLFVGLINYILTDNSINGKISSQRAELTDKLTGKARDILGANWESSHIRSFMNSLRRHVRGEEFNQDWSNGVLCSLAAVVLKGDDWEVLLDFMKRKGMTDYRLAFAFYGIFNGFANLTRDFTDLLLNNDSSYVASVYKEFHSSIHGEKIAVITSVLAPEIPISSGSVSSTLPVVSFKDTILEYYESNVRKGKKNQIQLGEELRSALDNIQGIDDGYLFVCVLNDYPTWKRQKKAWKEMQSQFCPDYEEIVNSKGRKTNKSKSSQSKKGLWGSVKESLGGIFSGLDDSQDYSVNGSNFQGNSESNGSDLYPRERVIQPIDSYNYESGKNSTESIIYDVNAINKIKGFLGMNNHPILDLFIKFQENYQTGYYSKNPNQYKRNNFDVIDHFCKWCMSSKNPKALDRTPANSRKLDDLKSYLFKIYRD